MKYLLLLLLLLPVATFCFHNSIKLREGVLFKEVKKVTFADEENAIYVRLIFKEFIEIQHKLYKYVPLQDQIKGIVKKLNETTTKLFEFIYTNFDQQNVIYSTDVDVYNFTFESHKTDVINGLLSEVDKSNYTIEKVTLLELTTFEIEFEILTFMVTLMRTIQSNNLSNYLVSNTFLHQLLHKLLMDNYQYLVAPSMNYTYEYYNIIKVEQITYNTIDYSLLLKINVPLIHSNEEYTIYQVYPIYTPSKYDDNYSVRLNAWWSDAKYLAVSNTLGDFMTFSDYSCRYVNILNRTICKDCYVRMRNDVDYCVFSLLMNKKSDHCTYMFTPKPTQEFINIDNGVWFYSFNADKVLKVKQDCRKRHADVIQLNENGTGLFMFEKNCHGSLYDNSYVFMSIDRSGKNEKFKNIDINIDETLLLSPRMRGKDVSHITLIIILYILVFTLGMFCVYLRIKPPDVHVIPRPSSPPPHPPPSPPHTSSIPTPTTTDYTSLELSNPVQYTSLELPNAVQQQTEDVDGYMVMS